MDKSNWILCPVCGNKTRDRLRENTILENYPLYCPKCEHENLLPAEKEVLYSDKYISPVSVRKSQKQGEMHKAGIKRIGVKSAAIPNSFILIYSTLKSGTLRFINTFLSLLLSVIKWKSS